MEYTIDTIVAAATLYPDRARVTLEGETEITTGIHRLVINELPLTLQPESVRVGGEGSAEVRLLGVDVARSHYVQAPAVKVQELEELIERLEDESRVLADHRAVLTAQDEYLEGLRKATAEYARGLARGKTTVEDQTRLTLYLREQDEEIRAAVRQVDQEQRELNRQLDKVRRELRDLQSARPTQRFQVGVDVEVLGDGSFRPSLSYVVFQAGWRPLYDLRLVEEDDEQRLELSYIAEVFQRTGQDWSDVQLTVSTARPALSQRLPELTPWYLDVFKPQPPPVPRAQAVQSMARQKVAADVPTVAGAAVDAAPAPQAASVATAAVQEAGAAVSFLVPGRVDVPSDGSTHKTTINLVSLKPDMDYLVVPKHTDAVFRRIKVVNDSPSPILAGQANLFFDAEFIGQTNLDYAPVGEEVELLLGVEERITVTRELVRSEVDKALLRDKRQLRIGYKIELQNLLSESVRIEVQDHVPLSRHEEIKVKLERVTPEPSERSDLNMLEWHLDLPSGGKQDISYNFQVEHPRSMQITGI